MTRPYAEVIGDPIAHSKSPVIHNFWLEKLGIEAEYRACHVRPEELADYFTQRRDDPNWRGCNVTIPHKEPVIQWLDHVRSDAARIGAINTAFPSSETGLTGINTDIDGVGEALRGVVVTDRPVAVIGAGGAARAAFAYLEGLGCAEVRVMARSIDKAARALAAFALPARIIPFEQGEIALDEAVAVINATQLGMSGQADMPRNLLDALALTSADSHVFDMVYAPLKTDLLIEAARLGRTTSHGLVMLVGQARTAFRTFFDKPPQLGWDAELFTLLTR